VGTYAITAGTLAATGNYTIGTFNPGTLTVNPAALTVTAANKSMTYGGTVPALTYSYTGLVNGDTSAAFTGSLTTTATSSSSVGTYAITQGSLAATGNYTIGTFNPGTLTVNPAALTVTANNRSMTYGGAVPALTYSYTGLVNGDSAATFTGGLATAATSSSSAGTYAITAGTLAATGNYTIGTFNPGTLTVNPAPLTVTANDPSMTFGGAVPSLTYTYSGLVNGDASATFTGGLATTATSSSSVGTYAITRGSLAATGNYTIGAFNAGTVTISPAALTVTAANQSMTYGGTVPSLTYTYSGLVNGDSAATFTGGLATTATSSSSVGTYAITAGTLAATGNYTIGTFNPGTLTVNPAGATVTYTGQTYVIASSSTATSASVTLAATVQASSGDITTATVVFQISTNGGTLVGTYPVTVSSVNSGHTAETVTANVSLSTGNNGAGATYTVLTSIGGNYIDHSTTDSSTVTVTVALPTAGSINGGGYIVDTASAGQYAGTSGLNTNFGFNVHYNKSLTNLQGDANVIDRSNGHLYQFKSNSLQSLSIPDAQHATFITKATVTDVTNPSSPITLFGNALMTISVYDAGGTGANDTIAITVSSSDYSKLYFSSNYTKQTDPQLLGGGNIQIRQAQFLDGPAGPGAPAGTVVTAQQVQALVPRAIARWQQAGIAPDRLAALAAQQIIVVDLAPGELGWQEGNTIAIDADASGYGWFVDATPSSDSAFAPGAVGSPAQGRVDLLTVLIHEMGHVLGYSEDSDAANTVMSLDLPVGVRRSPEPMPVRTWAASPSTTAAAPASRTATAHLVMGAIGTPAPSRSGSPSSGQSRPSWAPSRLALNTQVGARPSVILQAGPQENGPHSLGSRKASDRMMSTSIPDELALNLLQRLRHRSEVVS
jgi:hypothetical protein